MKVNENIVAIDGPAGVGKGTLTRNLCNKYGFVGLDTGSLYRAITLYLMRQGYDMEKIDPARAVEETKKISDNHEILKYAADPEIRSALNSKYVYVVADNAPLREVIKDYQVDFGRSPPPLANGTPAKGAVVEGRDIGTIIFPDAPVKIFLTAAPEIKASRRYDEYVSKGIEADYKSILAEMVKRDEADRTRKVGTLVPAKDSLILDTSDKSREEVLAWASKVVEERLKL
ncbi:MAG: (d)CMP kinase [Rickettsiales bacterium]|nr:(d)CMP kinase [Rickettsiales bacterium]